MQRDIHYLYDTYFKTIFLDAVNFIAVFIHSPRLFVQFNAFVVFHIRAILWKHNAPVILNNSTMYILKT